MRYPARQRRLPAAYCDFQPPIADLFRHDPDKLEHGKHVLVIRACSSSGWLLSNKAVQEGVGFGRESGDDIAQEK